MQYLEVTVQTSSAGIEATAAALTAEGFDSLVFEDQVELEAFLEENRAYWDYIDEDFQKKLQGLSRIKLYLPMDGTQDQTMDRLSQCLERLKSRLPQAQLGSLQVSVKPMAETDWSESWKDNYPPQPVGRRLVVLPYWLAQQSMEGRIPILLNPGLTFGTGAHPSTQMALAAMEDLVFPGCSVVDLGSGSGILSIAALRLGAKTAIGIDLDPKAEDIARENAAYNQFEAPAFTALTGNVIKDQALMERLETQGFDLVLVNIVADVILALAPVLGRLLRPAGTVILSGILDTRLEEVVAGVEQNGLQVTAVQAMEDWRCVCAKRR